MRAAQRLGVTGFVRNLPNGDVEAQGEGGEEALQQFRRELERGPRMALVTEVIESEIPISGTYASFLIRG
jgi:acylphosphatase